MDNKTVCQIMKLCLLLENNETNKPLLTSIFKSDDETGGSIVVNYSICNREGSIKYTTTLNSTYIDMIHNKNDLKMRLGHYLLGYLLIMDKNKIGCVISPYAENRRMGENIKGELERVVEKNSEGVGGRPSQLIHLNYGLLFNYKGAEGLLNNLEEFDAEKDFTSEENMNDSYFSQMVAHVALSCWESTEYSNKIRSAIVKAYSRLERNLLLIKSIDWFINEIESTRGQLLKAESENEKYNLNKKIKIMRGMKTRLKNFFIEKYEDLYTSARKEVQDIRRELKNKIKEDYYTFLGKIYTKVHSLIGDDEKIKGKFIHNIMESRGMREVKALIEDFNPESAGIPLPSPESIKKKNKLDILAKYIDIIIGHKAELQESLEKQLKELKL